LLWKLYKENTLHSIDAKAQTKIMKVHLHKNIRALHDDRQLGVRAADRRWFIPDLLTYFQTATTRMMQSKLSTYKPIMLDAIRLGHIVALVNTRSLRHSFPTTAFPCNPRHRAVTLNPRLHTVHAAHHAQAQCRAGCPRRLTLISPTVLNFFKPTCLPYFDSPTVSPK
jgi:hypothetical protein